MSFLQSVLSLDKTIEGINSILPIVSLWFISQQRSASRGVCPAPGLPTGGSASRGVCPHWGLHPARVGKNPPRHMGYYGIQPTSGRYASYWNAFLLVI